MLEKEEVKILFLDDVILFLENGKEWNYIIRIKWFSKVAK